MTASSTDALKFGSAYDPLSPENIIDPFPALRYFRETNPIHDIPVFGGTAFFRYEDCDAILRDQRFSHDFLWTRGYRDLLAQNPDSADRIAATLERRFFTETDPPQHTRLRPLVSGALRKSSVALLRERARQYCIEELDLIESTGANDIDLEMFASRPAARLLAEWAGFPVEDHVHFAGWARGAATGFDPGNPAAAYESISSLYDYLETLVADRAKDLGDDLVSHLITAETEGEKLSYDELLGVLAVLIVGAGETTASGINNAVLALMRNREQWDLLTTDPSLAAVIPTEAMRYDPVVLVEWRVAREDVEVGGVLVRAEDRVFPMLGAANRDPSQFSDPEQFDIRRTDNRSQLGWSSGIHTCVGIHLARMEMEVALECLAQRLPDLQLDGEPHYFMAPGTHIIEHLPLKIHQ